MRNIAKADKERIDRMLKEIEDRKGEVEARMSDLEDATRAVNEEIENLNEALVEAQGFVEDLKAMVEDYVDNRSEKWSESDAASQYSEWVAAFETASASLEPLELLDEDPEIEGFEEVAEGLINLPETPDEA